MTNQSCDCLITELDGTYTLLVCSKHKGAGVHAFQACPLHKAAPELLAALQELVDIVDGVIAGIGNLDSFTTQPGHAALARARAD